MKDTYTYMELWYPFSIPSFEGVWRTLLQSHRVLLFPGVVPSNQNSLFKPFRWPSIERANSFILSLGLEKGGFLLRSLRQLFHVYFDDLEPFPQNFDLLQKKGPWQMLNHLRPPDLRGLWGKTTAWRSLAQRALGILRLCISYKKIKP